MKWAWLLGVPGVLVLIVGTIVSFDHRYVDTAEAADMTDQRVQADLRLQLEIYREKLKRLRAKAAPTQDELDEIESTRAIISKIETEMLGK